MSVQTGIEFVNEQRHTFIELTKCEIEQDQQPPRACALTVQFKIDLLATSILMGKFDGDMLAVFIQFKVVRLVHRRSQHFG